MDVAVNDRPVVVTVPLRPQLHDHHLRILGLVKLHYLEVLQPQRGRHDVPRVLADHLPALQAHGRAGRPRERRFDHRVGRERSAKPSASPFRIRRRRRTRTSAGVADGMRRFPSLGGWFNRRSLNNRPTKLALRSTSVESNVTTPRPSSRAEQRRRTEARILDAATHAFVTAGYERTTIRAVASAAGVDAGLVMHYFGSKQELFRRVIDAAPVPEISGAPGQAAEQILAGLAAGWRASRPRR